MTTRMVRNVLVMLAAWRAHGPDQEVGITWLSAKDDGAVLAVGRRQRIGQPGVNIPGLKFDIWLAEVREFEANGNLPRLSILHLPNDHTSGTRPGSPTPRAMVAENDVALGRIVQAITNSRYWKESAIFVIEDDAQNGPDHVDAHRSVALVISPFARRGAVDSTLYSTAAMLRTIELILGLEPMSQYDASATPMYNAFQPTPVLTPYAALAAQVALVQKNDWNSPGASRICATRFTASTRPTTWPA